MDSEQASLVKRARAGSRDAFDRLVVIYQDDIYGYIWRMTGDAEAACDVAQNVLLRAYTSLAQLRDPARFRPWLFAMAVNQCRNWLKRQRRQPLSMSRSSGETMAEPNESARELADPDPSASPEFAADANELRLAVQQAIGSLPLKYREAAILRFQHELKVSQIAKALGIRVAAVESRLRRAKEMLRTKLSGLM